MPLTESGCAGGVVALARACDYTLARGRPALVVAAELCSLAFHGGGDDGNLTASLIFGDGAGAAVVEPGPGPGLQVIDVASVLIPGTEHLLGFELLYLVGVGGNQAGFSWTWHNLNVHVILSGKEQALTDRELTEAFGLLAG